MSVSQNGNGNGNGTHKVIRQLEKKVTKTRAASSAQAVKDNHVTFQSTEGASLRGMPVRVTCHMAIFELYNPGVTLRFSESLRDFQIIFQGRAAYSGRAVVRNVVDVGTKVVCEARLDGSSWTDLNFALALQREGGLAAEFETFLKDWQKLYKIVPEFKVVIADLHSFLSTLRFWLDHVEMAVRDLPVVMKAEREREALQTLEANPI